MGTRHHFLAVLSRLPDVDAAEVIDDLVAEIREGLHGNASGRSFGWVMGGSVPVAIAADWLASAWVQNTTL